jgi:ABC-type glycerol-3-phosphate transport system permease component
MNLIAASSEIQPWFVAQFLVVMGGLVLGVLMYFLPAYAASRRRHPNTAAIAVLNVFLGWTFIGWVIALVWALTNSQEKK